jgi:hypothetical protein
MPFRGRMARSIPVVAKSAGLGTILTVVRFWKIAIASRATASSAHYREMASGKP